jgi:hypothetical protein
VDLAVDDPSKGAAVGLDHPPRTQVAHGAGDQDSRSPSAGRLPGLGEHLGGTAAASPAWGRRDTDVAAGALQRRGEAVANDDRAQSALRYERTGVHFREPILRLAAPQRLTTCGRWHA